MSKRFDQFFFCSVCCIGESSGIFLICSAVKRKKLRSADPLCLQRASAVSHDADIYVLHIRRQGTVLCLLDCTFSLNIKAHRRARHYPRKVVGIRLPSIPFSSGIRYQDADSTLGNPYQTSLCLLPIFGLILCPFHNRPHRT